MNRAFPQTATLNWRYPNYCVLELVFSQLLGATLQFAEKLKENSSLLSLPVHARKGKRSLLIGEE